MFSRSSLSESGDNLHINTLRLSPSILLFWRFLSHSDDASSPERELSNITPPHSPSLERVSYGHFCDPRPISGSWREQRACRPSTSLQKVHDLTAACSNSHHFENSKQTRPEPKDSWIGTCLNCIHFDIQSRNQDIWLPSKIFIVIPAVYPRLF